MQAISSVIGFFKSGGSVSAKFSRGRRRAIPTCGRYGLWPMRTFLRDMVSHVHCI